MQSIHGQAIARGNWQAPVCTDCHGIHTIKAPNDPNSSVAAGNVQEHLRVVPRERAAVERVWRARRPRHLATWPAITAWRRKVGSNTVANCASCHGVHNILPSSDPRSTINHANLAKTCGQCHPGANEKFITSKVHLDGTLEGRHGQRRSSAMISKFYLWMIFAVIGGMVLHNLIIFRKKLILHRIGQPRILFRMTLGQRVQHLTLLISFFTLVLTGFALQLSARRGWR